MMFEFVPILLILFFSIVLHECAHGYVAFLFGDPTAKQSGRLTLNPLKHVDPFGTVILPAILVLIRMMGQPVFLFGWAKPVPVNPLRLRHPKRDMMWVGLAGPATNLFLAFIFSRLLNLASSDPVYLIVEAGVFINLLLAVFNLIPIPPLDGSRFVMGLLPKSLARAYISLERYGILIVLFLLYFGVLDHLIWPVINYLGGLLGVQFT